MPDAGFGGGPDNGRGENERGDDNSDHDSQAGAGLGSSFAGFGTDADAIDNQGFNAFGQSVTGWGDARVEGGRRDQTGFFDAAADTVMGRNVASRGFHRGLAGTAAGLAAVALGPAGLPGAFVSMAANALGKQAVDRAKDDVHTSFGEDLVGNIGNFAVGVGGSLYGSQFGPWGSWAGGRAGRGLLSVAKEGGKIGSGQVVSHEGDQFGPAPVVDPNEVQQQPAFAEFAGFVDTGEQHPFAEG